LTRRYEMGESKRGEGSGRRPRADQVIRRLVAEYSSQGIQIGEIKVQRITSGLFAVDIFEHGGYPPERFILDAADLETSKQ
jgi:hypothetical protein